ncbi:MAG: hypothetical protein KA248_12525 [Kiritimatiellae bacterium]|nr:hypothetical protein [Kiritimatiellia bacterium]
MNEDIPELLSTYGEVKLCLVDWQVALGEHFKKLKPFLVKCIGEITHSYPAPETRIRLDVDRRGDRFLAYATDEVDYDVEDILLTLKDVQLWRLDTVKITAAFGGSSPSVSSSPQPAPSAPVTHARYAVHRGLNMWRVIFDGVDVPGIGKNRGMFYVAYLLRQAGAPPIHALELEAKSLVFLRRECGLSEVVDQHSSEPVPLDSDAVIQELNLGKDDREIEIRLDIEERRAFATIESSDSPREKKLAWEKVNDIRDFRRLHFRVGSNPADKAAKRVRAAIDRLCEDLRQYRDGSQRATQAAHGFAAHIERHIRAPSAALWPKGGRSRRGHQAGHFQCFPADGIAWSIS